MNDARVERVLGKLKERGITQMLVCDPLSIWYLSGYYTMPHERFFALYLAEGQQPVLFANILFPSAEGHGAEVVTFSDTDDYLAMAAARCDHSRVLGVDKMCPARWLLPLRDLGAAAGFELASDAVDWARAHKDAEELALMRAASATNDAAMGWLRDQVRAGVTEQQIAEGLLGEYRRLGAQDHSFTPIVSFGANAADPHHEPDATVLGRGVVLFDVGCLQDWYCSDMTRSFFWGEPTAREIEVYDTVRRANEAAEAMIAPGVEFAAIDRAARQVIEDAGYGPYFTHRLGHQIGLEVHEPGDVSASHHEPVEPGMVFSCEPGIYLPGEVGVRIEDLVVVTEDGCEILNHFPHDLTVLG